MAEPVKWRPDFTAKLLILAFVIGSLAVIRWVASCHRVG